MTSRHPLIVGEQGPDLVTPVQDDYHAILGYCQAMGVFPPSGFADDHEASRFHALMALGRAAAFRPEAQVMYEVVLKASRAPSPAPTIPEVLPRLGNGPKSRPAHERHPLSSGHLEQASGGQEPPEKRSSLSRLSALLRSAVRCLASCVLPAGLDNRRMTEGSGAGNGARAGGAL